MNDGKDPRKRGAGGRPPKTDPSGNCVMMRFTDAQYAGYLTMYEQSGIRSKARFILTRIFGETIVKRLFLSFAESNEVPFIFGG